MIYSIPYGKTKLEFDTHDARVLFTGEMTNLPAITDIQGELLRSLDGPIGSEPLASLAQGKKKILFLVEDNTRETPLDVILPVIVDYLNDAGIPDEAISFLTAPGTHRIMTDEEIRAKLGEERGRIQGIAEGLAAGEMKKAKETALTLAEKGMSAADIADIVKVSVKLVQEWLSGNMGLVK